MTVSIGTLGAGTWVQALSLWFIIVRDDSLIEEQLDIRGFYRPQDSVSLRDLLTGARFWANRRELVTVRNDVRRMTLDLNNNFRHGRFRRDGKRKIEIRNLEDGYWMVDGGGVMKIHVSGCASDPVAVPCVKLNTGREFLAWHEYKNYRLPNVIRGKLV